MRFFGKGFWNRLAHDTRGNTLAIGAACLIPILAGLGGAIDFGRAYVTKSRLQQSCDAGVLAGRKAQGAGAYDTNAQQTAQRYFNFDFSGSPQGQRDVNFSTTQGSDGTVSGTAATTLDTAIIKLFGYRAFNLTVNCGAKMNLSDTDVMFVLDTTGSMGDTNPGDTMPKIAAMRAAVTNFYGTLNSSASSGTRIRYGFMPFSVTVNVGGDMKPDWMAAHWLYPSRRFDHADQSPYSGTNVYPDSWNDDYDGSLDEITGTYQHTETNKFEDCTPPPANTTVGTDGGGTHDHSLPVEQTWTHWYATNGTNYGLYRDANSNCILTMDIYDNYTVTHHYDHHFVPGHTDTYSGVNTTNYFTYDNYLEDTSAYKAVAGHPELIGLNQWVTYQNPYQDVPNGGGLWIDWAGCIEERWEVPLPDGGTQPAGTTGYDINSVPDPNNEKTQWGYYMPATAWMRINTDGWNWGAWDETKLVISPVLSNWDFPRAPSHTEGGTTLMSAQCPAPARKLSTISATDLSTYLNNLTFGGMTHLDIGILWGARYLSQNGIFKDENQDQSASKPTSRNIILMTDGQVETGTNVYGAYGLEAMIPRHTPAGTVPTSDQLASATGQSFSEICTSAKAQNITVWVIAFGTQLTPLLQDCATPGRAYMANNANELNNAFQNIAMAMAGLQIVS